MTGLSVGDAVLTFFGDTSNLDQAFATVAVNADRTMSAAADSVDKVGDSLQELSFELDATGSNAAYAGGEIKEAMGVARASSYEARGELGLLGEMFGIHLPRHVRSFVAEMPGVGKALSAAFAATAVFFLIEALVKGSEKLSDWISKTFIFTEAMKASDEAIKKQNETLLKLAEQIDKDKEALEKFGKTQAEIKSDKVAALGDEIAKNKKIFADASKAAQEYAKNANATVDDKLLRQTENLGGFLGTIADLYVRIAVGQKHVLDNITAFFTGSKTPAELAEEAKKAGQAAETAAIEAAKKIEDAKIQFALADKELIAQQTADRAEAAKKSIAIEQTIGEAKIKMWAAQATNEAYSAKNSAEALLKVKQEEAEKEYQLKLQTLQRERAAEQQAQAGYKFAGDEVALKKEVDQVRETNAKIEALNAEHFQKGEEQARAAETEKAALLVAGAKLELDAQLGAIEKAKAAELAAYIAGKAGLGDWEAAQVRATDAAAIAHEDYLKKVIAVYTRARDAQKAQSAQQELAALQDADQAKQTEKLATAMVKLTAATKEAKEQGQKLAEDKISQHFKDQEEAITKLASMHLISEEQKDDRLKLLEQQQANEALKILDDELKAKQKLLDEAQAKLAAARKNPASTNTELLELQAELQKEVAATAKAEDAKLQAQEKFNKASEANDKSHYGRALLMAIANGRELLAEQMKENHAALLAEQNELKLAKARGADTTAIQHKITALKQHEQELDKEANGDKKILAAQQQVTAQRLKDAQAILLLLKAEGQETTAIEKEIADLKKLEIELKNTAHGSNATAQAMDKLKDDTKAAAGEMLSSLSSAFAGIITGQQSFGKSMEEATLKMIGQMANHWGEYFAAKGIADVFTDPPLGGAELAASAALFAISGVMSGLASNAAKPGGASPQTGAGLNPTQMGGSVGGGGNQTGGTTKLARGGVVSQPTTFMAGDSLSGGDATEAVLPLTDPNAMRQVAEAIMPGLSSAIGIGSLGGTRDPKQEFNFAEPGTAAPPGFRFDGSTVAGSGMPTVGEALGFTPRFTPASYDSRLPAEKPGLSRSEALPSEKLPDDFGTPTIGDRPGFDFSQTPLPRAMPDMGALASQFGGLLSPSTLRAASGAQASVAASTAAPAVFDQAALEKLAGRLAQPGRSQSDGDEEGGGATHYHSHVAVAVKGMISPDNLNKVVKRINRSVQNRQTTLNATNSLRVTRRSQ